MFDGRFDVKLSKEMWVIRQNETGDIVFEYRTYQGNQKKAFFNSYGYAEEALNKYIKNPEDYCICKVK